MKKLLFSLFLIISFNAFCGDSFPFLFSSDGQTFDRVEITGDKTIFHFTFSQFRNFKRFMIHKDAFIKTNTGQKLYLIEYENLEKSTDKFFKNYYSNKGEQKQEKWAAIFPKINPDVTSVSLISPAGGFKIKDILINKNSSLSNSGNNSNPSSDFFTCREWIDKNMDNKSDDNEFIEKKKEFFAAADKTILFYALWHNKKGLNIKLEIFSPLGELYKSYSAIPVMDLQAATPSFPLMEMINSSSEGEWSYQWSIEGNVVFKDKFVIKKY